MSSPTSSMFTCLSCHVAFHTADHQRTHYRTDWHRYNLKRKVASLPPISAEVFSQKIQDQKAKLVQEDVNHASECRACGKTFASEGSRDQHFQSKKHRETLSRVQKGLQAPAKLDRSGSRTPQTVDTPTSDMSSSTTASTTLPTQGLSSKAGTSELDGVEEEVSPEDAELLREIDERIRKATRLDPEDCLFCTEKSASFEDNMEHMAKVHSFFIPDQEYLVDLRGLIKFLGEKVSVANVCLHCNGRGRGRYSIEAVRRHMIDKGHTKIAYDSENDVLELSEFYDFRSSYPDYKEQEEGEEQSEEQELEPDHLAFGDTELELVLPSGARLGHRSMNRYYKQRLRPEEDRDAVLLNRLLTQYGEDEATSGALAKASRTQSDSRALQLMSRFQRKQAIAGQAGRAQRDFDARVGQKANKLQKYFRAQVMF